MNLVKNILIAIAGCTIGMVLITGLVLYRFESMYTGRVYPGVVVGNVNVEGKTPGEIVSHFAEKSVPLAATTITLTFEDNIATFSGTILDLKFNGELASSQTYQYGRSASRSGTIGFKLQSFLYHVLPRWYDKPIVSLPLTLSYKSEPIDETLSYLEEHINIPAIEPLFEIHPETKHVSAFRLGEQGRRLNIAATKQLIESELNNKYGEQIAIILPVETIGPKTTADGTDEMGIVERIGVGESFFKGSISGRVHNILLSSSRISGVLVGPGEVFSFNETVGDISAATGYKSAYVIKNGRTVLGDGGGVCQVSTTLFRAALNAGLEIVERSPHSYRVSYYEQGGYQPGLDATVYYPTTDLKIKNNTSTNILITATSMPDEYTLVFEIYGASDGRTVQLSTPVISGQVPPPPPLYLDDPTLAAGMVKQVDWEAWGAKSVFDYTVTRGEEVLIRQTFTSKFQPWQAVYLKGPAG